MKSGARSLLARLGSSRAETIGWRDMWAMVTLKRRDGDGGKAVPALAEEYSRSSEFHSWGAPVSLRVSIPLASPTESTCDWGSLNLGASSDASGRRAAFCNHIEGYGSLCSCTDPSPLYFPRPLSPLVNGSVSEIPVAVIASNRPHYLFRMLRSLLSAEGANPSVVTVFIDGYYEEPMAVARLFGLRGIQHTPLGSRNARISQHYKASLTATFNIFPHAQHAIILEEDLDVSPDFFT
jgi:beta-1,2-N-acetylglucosaminyltransferase